MSELPLGISSIPFTKHPLTLELGRSWAITELRDKSWDDLHGLWWVCVKERNRIATSNVERERLRAGYGEHEAGKRDQAVSLLQWSPSFGSLGLCQHYHEERQSLDSV